jgi:osmotically inducible lipoprotein OsmB
MKIGPNTTHNQPEKGPPMGRTLLVAAVAMLAAACGTTTGDRAASGGLIGAGAGAAIGSFSGNAGAGALIGGVAGAAAGAVTDPCKFNLGDPVWKDQHASRDDFFRRCGYYPG